MRKLVRSPFREILLREHDSLGPYYSLLCFADRWFAACVGATANSFPF